MSVELDKKLDTAKILIAGFGGQGILFTGKFLVYTGMINDKQVSWLPSYGPEMRGGTANCSVIISDSPVGSPIVTYPNILVALNLPSFDLFEGKCEEGSKVFIDSSLIPRKAVRTDVENFYIPATKLADENGLNGLANMVIIGKTIRETGICSHDDILEAMKHVISERKQKLFDLNLKAIEIGYEYK